MSEIPPVGQEEIYKLQRRLEDTEIAIGLILAELSKQIDTEEVLKGALHRAENALYRREAVTQILDKIKSSLNTSLNRTPS